LAAGSPEAPPAKRASLSLPLSNVTPSTDSPAKRRISAAAAATASFRIDGLEHEFALPADVGRWGFEIRVNI
jgi:hypothetical protein